MAEKPFIAYEGDQPYFFVSYAHEDADLVYPEMAWIDEGGFNLWYDDGIHVGSVWRKALADALSGAAAMVFFATARSTESNNCLRELNFILDEDKPVFVVQLDDSPLPALLRLSLSDRQALVKSDHSPETYRSRLVSALSSVAAPVSRVVNDEVIASGSSELKTDLPSIAVLPPTASPGDDGALVTLADGVTGDVIARLSHWFWHIVRCPRDDAALSPQQIGERWQVRYVLATTVQRGGDRVRVTTRLTDARHGRELWAGRYEETGADTLAVQDRIVNAIDYDLQHQVVASEAERVRAIADEELDAWGLVARSWMVDRTQGDRDRARALLERAIEKDPDFALAHSLLGVRLMIENAESAKRAADRALLLARDNPLVLDRASMIHRVNGDPAYALQLAERVRQISGRPNPTLAFALIAVGRFEDALALSNALSDDKAFAGAPMALTNLVAGTPEAALEWARRGTVLDPRQVMHWAFLACAQARLGRADEARASLARATEINSTFTVDNLGRMIQRIFRIDDSIIESILAPLRELGLD